MAWLARTCARTCTLLALAALSFIAPSQARAQGDAAARPHVVVTLHDGSRLVGELVAQDSAGVTLHTDVLGQVLIPRAKIEHIAGDPAHPPPAAMAPQPPAGRDTSASAVAAPPPPTIQWIRTFNVSGNYSSAAVPGYSGETKGLQLAFGLERLGGATEWSLNVSGGYQRTEPNPAYINEAELRLTISHNIGGPFSLRAETEIEHDAVDELDVRVWQQVGLGWTPVRTPQVTLLLSPGIGYTEERGAGPELLGNARRQKFEDAQGLAVALTQKFTWRLPPAFVVSQELVTFHGLDDRPRLQYLGNLRLLGMVSAHVGMTIDYRRDFDSTIPAPINKTIERLSAGLQFSF